MPLGIESHVYLELRISHSEARVAAKRDTSTRDNSVECK